MAAGAWKVTNKAKKKLLNGTMTITAPMRIGLVKTLGATPELVSAYHSFTEVASQTGYTPLGKSLSAEAWTGADAANDTTMKFDASNVVWTATLSAITSIKGAVVYVSAAASANRHVLCYSTLTGTQFSLAVGNTLTIQMAATGLLELY